MAAMICVHEASKLTATPTPVAMSIIQRIKSRVKSQERNLHQSISLHPLVSGLGGAELTLSLLVPDVDPSSALLSRKPVQRSARDSLFGGDSKNSEDSEGVLGVR